MPKRKNADTKHRLLKFLADGQFHSGEELGHQLDISRAAIWKASQYIKELGLPLESVTGRGYRIREGLELLDTAQIQKQLSEKNQAQLHQVIIENVLDSTNEMLMSQLPLYRGRTVAVLAEYQTKGRGRRGKTWVSPFGRNIYLSLHVNLQKEPSQLLGLSPAIAITICKTLHALGIYGASAKWPNDILYNYKKLAGILIEMQAKPKESCQVVIGIGLNLELHQSLTQEFTKEAIDVRTITGTKPQRNVIAGQLLNRLIDCITQYDQQGLKPFLPEWQKLDSFYHKEVTLTDANQAWRGKNLGINEKGELKLQTEEGKEMTFVCGEVSLRAALPAFIADHEDNAIRLVSETESPIQQ